MKLKNRRNLISIWEGGAQKVVPVKLSSISPCRWPNMLLDQIHGRYNRKVITPSKGHGSNDRKVKETNIGYETQGKSVLNYLCPSLNVSLLFSAVRKSKEKVIEFPPSSQEDSFFEKVALGDEAREVSKVQHRAQG